MPRIGCPILFSLDETFDVGEDTGTPVQFDEYDVPFKFNGELIKLSVDLKTKDVVTLKEEKKRKRFWRN
jgi:hypothetical protein